jgi:hypothetical protein
MKKPIIFLKYFFRPVFYRFCPKLAAVRPLFFTAYQFLFSAGFELFCRIFGRLATVFFISCVQNSCPTTHNSAVTEIILHKIEKRSEDTPQNPGIFPYVTRSQVFLESNYLRARKKES